MPDRRDTPVVLGCLLNDRPSRPSSPVENNTLAEAESIDAVLSALVRVWPTVHEDVVLPLEEDVNGVRHDVRGQPRCATPARIVELGLGEMLAGERLCGVCMPSALRPVGRIARDLASRTLCLRVALADEVTATERARAAVLTVWNGPSRFLPRPVFERVRATVLLPLLASLAEETRERDASSSGPLVAFTAGDMRFGMDENPELYQLIARRAAVALVHASPQDGVWLLHDPYGEAGTRLPRWPILGRVLLPEVHRTEIDLAACEVFGVLADDALAGSGSWEDLPDWWTMAKRLV